MFRFYIPWKDQKIYDVFMGHKKETPDSNWLRIILSTVSMIASNKAELFTEVLIC